MEESSINSLDDFIEDTELVWDKEDTKVSTVQESEVMFTTTGNPTDENTSMLNDNVSSSNEILKENEEKGLEEETELGVHGGISTEILNNSLINESLNEETELSVLGMEGDISTELLNVDDSVNEETELLDDVADLGEKNAMEKEPTTKLLRLPSSRVRNIIKLDPDVRYVQPEAVFLITKATELLIDSFVKEAHYYTVQEKKKTVLKKHLELAVSNVDAFAYFEGLLDQ